MSLRSEYINQQQVAILQDLRADMRAHRVDLSEDREEWRKRFEDQRDEDRAQREALLRILDRLDGKDPPAQG